MSSDPSEPQNRDTPRPHERDTAAAPLPAYAADALSGAFVAVTRPAAQAAALCAQIDALGGQALALPLLAIEALPATPELRGRFAANARSAEWWIFTSANAVAAAAALLPPPWGPRIAAVGAATAAALRRLGVREVAVPGSEFSGAALAASSEFAAPEGRRIGILTGEDGRSGELATTLAARGAQVELLALYRRVPLQPSAQALHEAIVQCDVFVVTSAESLLHLHQLVLALEQPLLHAQLLQRTLLLPSPRVAELAVELGFTIPALLPERVSDEAFVRRLVLWWQNGDPEL